MLNEEGLANPARLRKARRHRAHLLATQGLRIQRIAERCGVSIAVAKGFLNEKIIVRTRAEPSDLPNGVRRVKGGAYQARPWLVLGPRQALNVNLGLFHPEDYEGVREHRSISEEQAVAAAGFAARSFLSRMAWNPRPDIWHAIQKLQAERRRGYPTVALHVLPPLIRRVFAPAPPHDCHGFLERDLLGFAVGRRRPPYTSPIYSTAEEAWAVAKPLFEEQARKSCQRRQPQPALASCSP